MSRLQHARCAELRHALPHFVVFCSIFFEVFKKGTQTFHRCAGDAPHSRGDCQTPRAEHRCAFRTDRACGFPFLSATAMQPSQHSVTHAQPLAARSAARPMECEQLLACIARVAYPSATKSRARVQLFPSLPYCAAP